MRSRLGSLAALAALAALSCSSGSDGEAPRPASVDPAAGPSAQATRVTIHGDGFLTRPSTKLSGGGAEVDVRHRAWLGDTELEQVTWVDVRTLQATVPAGLAPGSKRLVVENALGRQGALDDAFEVTGAAPAALAASIAADRDTANVGQAVSVTLTVLNGGHATANLTSVVLDHGGTAAATCGSVTPAPGALGTGASATFHWTCTASAPGTLSLSGTAGGTDATSGDPVSASSASPASVLIQTPAALDVALAVEGNPAEALIGQTLAISLTVQDTGQAGATVTRVEPTATPADAVACGAPTPSPPQPVAGAGARAFAWTCTPLAAVDVALGASVGGTDANTGATLQASAPTASLHVLRPAELTAALAVDRTTADVDQPVHVTFTLFNGGTAAAEVASIVATRDPAATSTCTAPAPGPGRLAAGASATFTWTCSASAAGLIVLGGTASGTDAVSGGVLGATASPAEVLIQAPAALTGAITAQPTTTIAGQPVALTLEVSNPGGAAAEVTSVAPTGPASAVCGAVTPATPVIIPGGGRATFQWPCTPTDPGSALLGATADATDVNTGARLRATASTTVAVDSGGVPAVAEFTASPLVASPGQPFGVTLTIANVSAVTTQVTGIVPSMTGATAGNCSAPAPGLPRPIPAGANQTFTWSCTAGEVGSYALEAAVTSAPALAAQPTPVPVTVQAPGHLAPATVQASRSTISVGQAIPVSLLLVNDGQGTAGVTAFQTGASRTSGTGAATCTAAAPAPPQAIAGGGSLTFGWTCTGTGAGSVALEAAVTARDAGSGADASPTVTPAAVAVQAAPQLTGTLTPSATSVPVNTPAGLTLVIANGGEAGARITAVTPTATPAGLATCMPVAPPVPVDVPGGGGSATFTWSCTPSQARSYTLGATVTAADVNGGPAPTVTVHAVTVSATAP
ncbi:IPT/TIG domain-containing protein [Anaeromyxobacter sp. Red801]|uniref:IPT/TIG domain-containing protein n=1 Tax=Anaeromyxobacter sp. Red801 TaxID=3411632 RepID=UPI003B9DCED7